MMQKNPVLIFDEPTNHLDLEAVSALAEGLSIFPGTVYVVSHDRDLISDVATRVLSFTPERLARLPRHLRRISTNPQIQRSSENRQTLSIERMAPRHKVLVGRCMLRPSTTTHFKLVKLIFHPRETYSLPSL